MPENTSQIDALIQLDHFHKILCNGSKYLICSCCNSQKIISSYDPTVNLSLELSTLYNQRVQDLTSLRFNDIFQASLSLEVSNSYVHPVVQSVHVGFIVKNLFVNICNCCMCIQDETMAIIILIQAGHEFTYSGWSGGQIEIIGGASSGTVVQSNFKVCDSAVVHIINAVLLPSSPLSTIPSQPSHNEPDKLISLIFFLPASLT